MAIAAKKKATEPEVREDAAYDTAWLRNDGVLENAITGINDPNYDKTVHTVVAATKRLSYIDQQNLYEGSWICRRICDAYPIESTRAWVNVTLGGNAKPELGTKFMQYQERLDVKDVFKLGQTWANIYKGAAAIIHVDDGRKPDEPINRNNIRSVLDIEVLDYLDIRPNTSLNINPLRPDYYELVNRVSVDADKNGKRDNFRNYHPDRIIRFDGFDLPPKAMIRNQNWGGSLLDSIYTAFNRYESGNAAAANMVQDFNVFIYALKNLGNLIGANDEKSLLTLRNRLKSMRLSMSNLKGLVLDADGESATFISRNFAGLAEVLDRFRDELIGASGLPHTAVFGDAAGGLGSTGESEEVTWAKMVHQFQETIFRKKLRPVFDLIWLAKDGPTKGKIPDDWGFDFKPLVQESEKEKVDTRNIQSQMDAAYIQMQAVTKEEIRQSRFGGSSYSYETTLDEEAWKKTQEADQFDFSGMGLGGDEGGDPGASPDDGDPNGGGLPDDDGNGAIAPGAAVRNGNGGAKAKQDRRDSADARKRVETVQGLSLDVTHAVGDFRFGQPLQVEYARIRGSYGHAKDGRAHDVIKGPNPDSTKLFKFYQKNPATGLLDETKYGVGFDDIMSARDGWASMLPGGIHSPLYGSVDHADWSELQQYRQDCSADCGCEVTDKPAEKPPLLRLRRKQKPYGRELELIEDEPETESDRTPTGTTAPKRTRAQKTKQKQAGSGDSDDEKHRGDEGDRTDAKGKPCGKGWTAAKNECQVEEEKPVSKKSAGLHPGVIAGALGIAAVGLGAAAIAANQGSQSAQQEEVAQPTEPEDDSSYSYTYTPPKPVSVEISLPNSTTDYITPKFDGLNQRGEKLPLLVSANIDRSIKDLCQTLRTNQIDTMDRDTWEEKAYTVQAQTGKLSRRYEQAGSSVKVGWDELDNGDHVVIHSHPSTGSLSLADVWSSDENNEKGTKRSDCCIAVDIYGNVYKGLFTREQSAKEKASNAFLLGFGHTEDSAAQRALLDVKYKQRDSSDAEMTGKIRSLINSNSDSTTREEQSRYEAHTFVETHARNIYLQEKGVIDYAVQLTPKFQQIADEFHPLFEEVRAIARRDKNATSTTD